MNELKVIVLGAGDRGAVHVKGWQAMPNARIVGIVDSVVSKASMLALGCRCQCWGESWRKALDQWAADVVSIALPTSEHVPAIRWAFRRGMDVFCEKPLSQTSGDVLRVIEEKERKLAVCFQLRAMRVYEEVRDILAEEVGRPFMMITHDFREIRPKIAMHDPHVNGGPIVDCWCHQVDLMRWFTGCEPESVYAQGYRWAQGHQSLEKIEVLAHDSATVTAVFTDGSTLQSNMSWGLPKTVDHEVASPVFVGPGGVMEIGENIIYVNSQRAAEPMQVPHITSDAATYNLIQRFARVVRGESQPNDSAWSAYMAQRASLAALRSIDTGEVERI